MARATADSASFARIAHHPYLLVHGGMKATRLNPDPTAVWRNVSAARGFSGLVHHHLHGRGAAACERNGANRLLTYNERALLDMWASRDALAFIGTTASSFSNGVTAMRSAIGKISFAYSCLGAEAQPLLIERVDGGERPGHLTGDVEYCQFVRHGSSGPALSYHHR